MSTTAKTAEQDLRSQFLLRPGVRFLNHGSFGACPRPVFEAYQKWQRELEAQPVEFIQRRLKDLLQITRNELGGFIGADPEDVVLVTNASMGLNIVARSLKFEKGDQILSTTHEYGTLNRTWELICERTGAEYVCMPVHLPITSAEEVIDAIWSGVTDRTRVLFISHITSPTALTFPIAELITRARKAGIISIIDGAHCPGQISLNLDQLGADFYSGNCHKWMMTPKGSGFLHARREMHDLLDPLVGGRAPDTGEHSRLIADHQYQGTREPASYLAISDALKFMRDHDWDTVRSRCHELVRYARKGVYELTGLPAVCPDSLEWFAQMSILPIPKCDGKTLKSRLYEEYGVELPITGYNGNLYVRISVQGYNTKEDVDVLLEGLRKLLPQVVTQQ